MTKRLTIALVAVALFVLMAVMPVSATIWANGTVINQGATIFIGEEGLNVTHAMNQAYYTATGGTLSAINNNSAPPLTVIGWWASAAVLYTTSPSRTIDLGVNRRYAQMTVAPSDFVGYTGNWYLLDSSGARPVGTSGEAAMVFSVMDPSLDLKIWDYNQNTDVTGKSVPQGEKLGFRIDTNMYPAVDARYRSNLIDDSYGTDAWELTTIWNGAAASLAPPYQATNALIDSSYHWTNETITVREGTCIVCSNTFDVYVQEYTNYTSAGGWMTWSDGYGCDIDRSEIMYWNESNRMFQDYYGLGDPITTFDTTASGDCSQWYPVKATDGYIDIKVKDESNAQINKLYNQSVVDTSLYPGPFSVLKNFVDNQPWFWGTGTAYPVHLNADNQPYDGNVWATGSLDAYNQYNYPVGTYTVCAESKLNKMKDNYKQGGADYTGKTVSQCYTITLVSDSVKIEANKDSVVRSKTFSVTVTGRPSTDYYLWVKGTSSMLGGYDDQSPMMVLNQEGVFLDAQGSAGIWPATAAFPNISGMYVYENGGGFTIADDVSSYPVNGTRNYARIHTSTSGTRTIEFTTTNWTKAQKYTIRVENEFPAGSGNYKNDEVDVKVEKGAVTIVAAGDQSYYLGEEIKFSGTNTETYKTYLFIVGPNLADDGSNIANVDPRHFPSKDNVVSTFKAIDVNGDNTWSWKWGTANYALDAGTYTIYAVSQPLTKASLAQAAYGTVSIIIKKPFVSATASQSTVAKGDRLYITGTAEGDPSSVQIWILGKNFYTKATESVNSDASFKYEVRQETTRDLYSGQYFVVVQHPMQNNRFDVDTIDLHASLNQQDVVNDLYVYNLQLKDSDGSSYTRIFKLGGSGSLQGSDAAEALVQGINDANVDDTYTKLQFLVEEPVIRVDPIGDKHVGDKFTITAQTNLAVDDEILVQVYSSSFKPTQKSQSGEFSGATGTVKVTKGDSGMNKVSFDVDSSTFKPDEYIVTEAAVIQEATGTALFNVLETSPVTVAPTTVAVATTIATQPPTQVATTVPPTPVPTKSPGYGALIALIGLGAVAFIVVRRH
jgi:trimeric autotransporter adhesin